MAGEATIMANTRLKTPEERRIQRLAEHAARAFIVIEAIEDFRTMNLGRTETARLNGVLHHIGFVEAAILAWRESERKVRP
jgi:hypothetical protein